MRGRLRRLERAARPMRDMETSKAVFANHMRRLRAMVNGEEPPAVHPEARNSRYAGDFFAGGVKDIGPVEDLSE